MDNKDRDESTRRLIHLAESRGRKRRRIRMAIIIAVVTVLVVGAAGYAAFAFSRAKTPGVGGASSTTVTALVAASVTATTSPTTTGPTTTGATTTTNLSVRPLAFDASVAMTHIKKFADDIGVRRGGTDGENRAAEYAVAYLKGLGYSAELRPVSIPNGLTSHNVVAVKQGSSNLTIVIGGHMDSKKPAPGANDNASGSAAVLELARDLKDATITPTIIFVLFGNEEMIDSNASHHHYGSRGYVAQMTAEQRQNLVGMISLDMVAYGSAFKVRTMGKGPQLLQSMLLTRAKSSGVSLAYMKDTSSAGYSDHEAFELAGYPAVWLEWREDPNYHTVKDTYQHVDSSCLRKTGEFVLGFVSSLTTQNMASLNAATRH